MFGELKSKIETYLTESYKKNTLKDNLFVFEQLVLNNKNIAKIFFLYDELSDKKGLTESIANDFLNESIVVYETTINKIYPVHIKELKAWIGHVKCENKYSEIDNLFSKNILTLESKIRSKKIILENLKKNKENKKEVLNVPLKSMINVANKTVKNYIASLSESEQKEIKIFLNAPKKNLKENYINTKEEVVEKLQKQKNGSNIEISKTIDEVLTKLQTESFSELNYYKLKKLNEGL